MRPSLSWSPLALCSHPSYSFLCPVSFISLVSLLDVLLLGVPYPWHTLLPYICRACSFISLRFLLKCNLFKRSLPQSPCRNGNTFPPQIYVSICCLSRPLLNGTATHAGTSLFCSLLCLEWCLVPTRNHICWTNGEWMISLLNRWGNVLIQRMWPEKELSLSPLNSIYLRINTFCYQWMHF